MTDDEKNELFSAGVRQALRTVIDPELGENVVDLGLIYAIAVEDGVVRIDMTTTTRGCPATNYLKDAVQTAAWSLPDIHYVEVTLTYEPPWTPDRMNDVAKEHLGFARTGMRA
jgi:metal-sulfur cluster biosynthetic enzyme